VDQSTAALHELGEEGPAVQVLSHQDLRALGVGQEGIEEAVHRPRSASRMGEKRGDRLALAGPDRLQHLEVEGLLRGPVAVEERDVAASSPGDALHPGPVVAAEREFGPSGRPQAHRDTLGGRVDRLLDGDRQHGKWTFKGSLDPGQD